MSKRSCVGCKWSYGYSKKSGNAMIIECTLYEESPSVSTAEFCGEYKKQGLNDELFRLEFQRKADEISDVEFYLQIVSQCWI